MKTINQINMKTKRRKRYLKIVKVLSELYGVAYQKTLEIYIKQNKDIDNTRIVLNMVSNEKNN